MAKSSLVGNGHYSGNVAIKSNVAVMELPVRAERSGVNTQPIFLNHTLTV